jgi:microcystin-dependent protein
MSEPFIGEIRMTGWNFAARGWALCNGQLLPIQQNTALFSLLGTTFGGNGQTTFALPDLRGRVPINQGQGPGLTNRTMGENAGSEHVTLNQNQMPAHQHLVKASEAADTANPANAVLGADSRGTPPTIYNSSPDSTTMNPQMIAPAGGNQPHDNMQPYLCVNFIIALEGIYPSRP